MKVPFFDMAAELAVCRPAVDVAIKRVLDSGVFVGGPEVTSFENELASATGSLRAIGVSSGTDALLAIYMACGVGPQQEVITSPLTFFATAGGIARLGARLVFADVDDTTLTLDPQAALAACSSHTRAIVPVHLFGCPAELPATKIPVIEDAAQSIGAGPVQGLAAALSFFPTKNLGAVGDAGAVLTNDPELADRVQLIRSHGAWPKYHHVIIGANLRLDAVQAAVLRAKLPMLAAATGARRRHAAHYRELCAANALPAEIRLPPLVDEHVYNQFVVRVPRREALRSHLSRAGIETEIYYPAPLHLQPCFEHLGYTKGSFPVAEKACGEVLALPIHPALSANARAYVVEKMAAFYRS